MTQINTFGDNHICRELSEDSLFIMAYNKTTSKYYQKILTHSEWSLIINNFTLDELLTIFNVCHKKQIGYDLQIDQNGNSLLLKFMCKEKIKTYRWQIELLEKNLSDMREIDAIFMRAKNLLQTIICNDLPKSETNLIAHADDGGDDNSEIPIFSQKDDMLQSMIKFMDETQNQINELVTKKNKESQIMTYIAEYQNASNKKITATKETVSSKKTKSGKSAEDSNNDEESSDDEPLPSKKFAAPKKNKTRGSDISESDNESLPDKKSSTSKKNVVTKRNKTFNSEVSSSEEDYEESESSNSEDYYVSDTDDGVRCTVLTNYKMVENIFKVPLGTYIKYFTEESDGSIINETNGYLYKLSPAHKYIYFNDDNNNQWKELVKNKVFYQHLYKTDRNNGTDKKTKNNRK